jgi:hypothetical protein
VRRRLSASLTVNKLENSLTMASRLSTRKKQSLSQKTVVKLKTITVANMVTEIGKTDKQ